MYYNLRLRHKQFLLILEMKLFCKKHASDMLNLYLSWDTNVWQRHTNVCPGHIIAWPRDTKAWPLDIKRWHDITDLHIWKKFQKIVWSMNTEEKNSPHYYSKFILKKHEIAWLSFLLWTRGGLHITVPWASSLGVLSWNETSTVTIKLFEYDSLFLFYIFKQNN